MNEAMNNRLIPVLTGNRAIPFDLKAIAAVNPRAYGEQMAIKAY